MPRWTLKENEVCIQELSNFRNYMKSVKYGEKGKKGQQYARKLLEQCPKIWIHRNESSLYQHLNYLNKLTAKRIKTNVKSDEKYYGILLEEEL